MKAVFATLALFVALAAASPRDVCGCFHCPEGQSDLPTTPRGPINCQVDNVIPLVGPKWTCTYNRANGELISKTSADNNACSNIAPCRPGCIE